MKLIGYDVHYLVRKEMIAKLNAKYISRPIKKEVEDESKRSSMPNM